MNQSLDAYLVRLNQLVSELMSVQLGFIEAEVIGVDWREEDLHSIVSAKGFAIPRFILSENGQIGIPVLSGSRMLGLVIPSGISDLESKRLALLSEFVRLTASEHFAGRSSDEPERVVSIAPSLSDEVNAFEEPQLLPPLLLSSGRASALAIDLHGTTEAWAMFTITDISDEVFDQPNGLRELGHVTIFIPDLAAVSLKKQLRLAEHLSSKGCRVQVVANMSELAASGQTDRRVLPHLLECFRIVPRDEQTSARDIQSWLDSDEPKSQSHVKSGLLLAFPNSTLH